MMVTYKMLAGIVTLYLSPNGLVIETMEAGR
jgi:hypothetical protein